MVAKKSQRKSKSKAKRSRRSSRKRRSGGGTWEWPDMSWLFSPLLWAILMFTFAILTVGTFLSQQPGTLLLWWHERLRRLVGNAIYLVPLASLMVGWWLLRYSVAGEEDEEAMPSPTWRVVGVGLVLAGVAAAFHLFSFSPDPVALAEAGGGGGVVGLVVSDMLVRSLGPWLAIPVLAGLILVGAMLALAASLTDLVHAVRYLIRLARGAPAPAESDELPPWEPIPSVDTEPPAPSWWQRLRARLPFGRRPHSPAEIPTRIIGEEQVTDTPTVSPYVPVDEMSPPEPAITESAPPPASPAAAPATTMSPAQPKPRRSIETEMSGQPWQLPDVHSLFEDTEEGDMSAEEIRQRSRIIEETLASFGVPARVVEVNRGPTVTQFGVQPGYIERVDRKTGTIRRERVKVSRIVALQNDLALALAAAPIRIQAPVPGKPYIGIEVPNKRASIVTLRSILESEVWHTFKGRLKIALGRDVAGQPVVADLARMPHLLIAGATGSGKSVCINAIIACLMATHTPDEVRFVLIDPKRVELTVYNGVPHVIGDVVTDVDLVVDVLQWAVREMERRYLLFAEARVRDIVRYNRKVQGSEQAPLPYIVIIIDELADLMLSSPDEVERAIVRLAQMARATGMHLVVATQRPSVDVVTGLIKANFPARIAFAVTSQIDSRVILDTPGAEQLLGQGDMLFLPPDSSKLARLQGVYVSDREIQRLVAFWKEQRRPTPPPVAEGIPTATEGASPETPAEETPAPPPAPSDAPTETTTTTPPEQPALWDELLEDLKEEQQAQGRDPLFDEAVRVVREANRASISLLQRRLKIGYARAGRLIDQLEEAGIIGPDPGGGRSRVVYPPETPPAPSPETAPEEDAADDATFASEAPGEQATSQDDPPPSHKPRRPRVWF